MLTTCITALLLTQSSTQPPRIAEDCCCHSVNARYNFVQQPKTGYDFVPLVDDDSIGVWVAYSAKQNEDNTAFASTACMYVIPLDGDEVLVFGGGFGDTGNIPGGAYFNADYDATMVRDIIGGCMRRDPETTRVRFFAPHGHPDHITVAFIRALERIGLTVVEIAFHEGDRAWIEQLPWLDHHPALFNVLQGGDCNEDLGPSFTSELGRIWFTHRPGHTPGSIDLLIDLFGNPDDRVLILGSVVGGCPPPPGVTMTLPAHGTVMMGGPRRARQQIMNGIGVNRACLSAPRMPKLGTTWLAEVEVEGHPDAYAVFVLGTDCLLDPGKLTPYGELLVNPRGNLAIQGMRLVTGTTETLTFPIPNDPSLMGRSVYVQGTIVGGGIEFCNALKLVIGF